MNEVSCLVLDSLQQRSSGECSAATEALTAELVVVVLDFLFFRRDFQVVDFDDRNLNKER